MVLATFRVGMMMLRVKSLPMQTVLALLACPKVGQMAEELLPRPPNKVDIFQVPEGENFSEKIVRAGERLVEHLR